MNAISFNIEPYLIRNMQRDTAGRISNTALACTNYIGALSERLISPFLCPQAWEAGSGRGELSNKTSALAELAHCSSCYLLCVFWRSSDTIHTKRSQNALSIAGFLRVDVSLFKEDFFTLRKAIG